MNTLLRTFWRHDRNVDANLLEIDNGIQEAEEWLEKNLGEPYKIDEAAFLLPSQEHVIKFCHLVVREPGVELFNQAQDEVQTRPFRTSYGVYYSFLRVPRSYRLEVMALSEGGHSPLHDAMWPSSSQANLPIAVHLSFKCRGVAEYNAVTAVLPRYAIHGMSCESNYGRFSYWLPNSLDSSLYLKPRVNLRDDADPVPASQLPVWKSFNG